MAKPGLERFVPNRAGYRAIMRGQPVQAILQAKANRVAAELRSELAGEDDWEIVSDVRVGRNRAGALVSGVPLRIELERRIMARALHAAR